MKKHLLYFFLLLCFACACKKLPKETHKGKDMMACYVNGEKWEAKDRSWGFNINIGTGTTIHNPSVIKTSSYFSIFGSGKKKEQGNIEIQIINFIGVGEYILNDNDNPLVNGFSSYVTPDGWGFSTDSIYTGRVNIKYYEEGKVCAGTFYFEAINRRGETINITEGRFDIGTFD